MRKGKMAASRKKIKKDYVYAVGRRRTSSARVRLHKGNKESLVNGQVIGKYFPGATMRSVWQKPFELTGTTGKYYITARVMGGGKQGQLRAVVHGLARAFSKRDTEKFRKLLKDGGLLTRDSRKRQRRMVGTGGKSRRAKQSPKR